MGFKDLPHVHARRHAQGVQHEVNRRAVCKERHVLHRDHLGNHALVAVTSGHLVARLQLALHGDEDLDHLHHTRRQVVATTDLFDLVLEAMLKGAFLRLVLLVQGLDLLGVVFFANGQLPPLTARQLFVQQLLGDLGLGLHALRTFHRDLADQHGFQTRIDVAIQDRHLVVPVTGQTFDFLTLDLQRTFVFLHTVAVEDAHFHDRTESHPAADASEVSRTSEAFSPKMARRSFSSGVIGLSPFGVILPTRMSPGPTSAPI